MSLPLAGEPPSVAPRVVSQLQAFEPLDVDNKHHGATNLDLKVLGHIQHARFERRGIRDGDLGPAAAGAAQNGHHRRHDVILHPDEQARIARP